MILAWTWAELRGINRTAPNDGMHATFFFRSLFSFPQISFCSNLKNTLITFADSSFVTNLDRSCFHSF